MTNSFYSSGHWRNRLGEAAPRLGTALCVAIGIWLGFPNNLVFLPPLVFLWPLGLALLGFTAGGPKQAFLWGWLSMCAGSIGALYWLSFPVHYVGSLPWPLAYACALLIIVCLGVQGGIFSVACHFCRFASPWLKAVFAAMVWFLLEWSFAIFPAFPWLQLPGALAPWPLMLQLAEFCGAWLTGSLWIFAILLIIAALPLWQSETAAKKLRIPPLCCGVIIIALILWQGWRALGQTPFEPAPDGPESIGAIFVEGNIDQNQKWVPAFQLYSLRQYLRLTREGVVAAERAHYKRPIIIWPETAMPFFFEKKPELARQVAQCAVDAGCPLLFGAPGVAKIPGLPKEAVFNRAFLLGPGGNVLGQYDKAHLVPFGEYLPSWLDFKFLKALLQGVGIYQEGTSAEPLVYGPVALGMLICYEGIFPWIAGERVAAGANILVDISNDGWFGESPASRQHLYLTTLRCIEQGRWLLRGTNTGISAVCDSRGRITMAGPQFKAEYLLGRAKLENGRTIYQQTGPFLPPAVFIAILILCGIIIKDNRMRLG